MNQDAPAPAGNIAKQLLQSVSRLRAGSGRRDHHAFPDRLRPAHGRTQTYQVAAGDSAGRSPARGQPRTRAARRARLRRSAFRRQAGIVFPEFTSLCVSTPRKLGVSQSLVPFAFATERARRSAYRKSS